MISISKKMILTGLCLSVGFTTQVVLASSKKPGPPRPNPCNLVQIADPMDLPEALTKAYNGSDADRETIACIYGPDSQLIAGNAPIVQKGTGALEAYKGWDKAGFKPFFVVAEHKDPTSTADLAGISGKWAVCQKGALIGAGPLVIQAKKLNRGWVINVDSYMFQDLSTLPKAFIDEYTKKCSQPN
jgi:hypothetical protein